MDRNRLWVLGAALLIGIMAVLGWMLGVSPKLDEARAANADRVTVETQNSAYELQLATLKKQFENIGDLRADLAALRQAVPSEADMPAFVGQLDAIAEQHQVTLTEISVDDAEPYVPVAAAAPVPADASAASSGDSAAGATAAPAAAPAATAAAAATAPVVSGLVTAENFIAVPISLSVDGSYDNVLDFIEGLQKGKRLVMVTKFDTAAAASDSVTAKISAFVYVLLNPNAATTPAG